MADYVKIIVLGTAALALSACASTAPAPSMQLKPAPPSSSMELADSPVVATTPSIARTPPIKVVKDMLKGDEIEIKPPVPVLSAVMPKDTTE